MIQLDPRSVIGFRDALGRLRERTRAAMRHAMRLGQGTVHRSAAGVVPVDTGRLKNSLFQDQPFWDGETIFGDVGTNVEYAGFVEEGTRYMDAQPYLAPSLTDNERVVNDLFANELRQAQRV